MKTIDTRGFSCPQPVLMVKEFIDKGEPKIVAVVDAGAPRENVARFAEFSNYEVYEEKFEDGFKLILTK